jgi:hypothetical protein
LWFWLLRVRVPLATHFHFLNGRFFEIAIALEISHGTPAAKGRIMLNPAVIESHASRSSAENFWSRILTDEELGDCDDLQKLLVGCEIIAALDAVDLLAA